MCCLATNPKATGPIDQLTMDWTLQYWFKINLSTLSVDYFKNFVIIMESRHPLPRWYFFKIIYKSNTITLQIIIRCTYWTKNPVVFICGIWWRREGKAFPAQSVSIDYVDKPLVRLQTPHCSSRLWLQGSTAPGHPVATAAGGLHEAVGLVAYHLAGGTVSGGGHGAGSLGRTIWDHRGGRGQYGLAFQHHYEAAVGAVAAGLGQVQSGWKRGVKSRLWTLGLSKWHRLTSLFCASHFWCQPHAVQSTHSPKAEINICV